MKTATGNNPQNEILQRLRTSEGHLHAVIEMAQAGRPCEEVLHQLQALESALAAAGRQWVLYEAQCCQAMIRENPCSTQRVAQLKRLENLYKILVHSNRHEVWHG